MITGELETGEDFGPAMLALTEPRRRFVLALLDQTGKPNYADAARAAGYSDKSDGAKVTGHHLAHNARVIAALHEESRKRFTLLGWRGVLGLSAIADDRDHPDHFKALKELSDRFGYGAVTEHKVTVERKDMTGAAMTARIAEFAAKHGLPVESLLGANAAPDMKLIEGEIIDADRS